VHYQFAFGPDLAAGGEACVADGQEHCPEIKAGQFRCEKDKFGAAGRTPSPAKLSGHGEPRSVPSLALMDDFERISVRVKYIGGVVSRIVFHSCPG
jgi:hypothetical protein